eukprot:GHVU01206127.1.p1 GENE.GHVU01206127.1~~GHVU01206127.1.p1  ORF type:complete len:279 (-),score=-14.82 GHVU01206127.1:528-1364(-)
MNERRCDVVPPPTHHDTTWFCSRNGRAPGSGMSQRTRCGRVRARHSGLRFPMSNRSDATRSPRARGDYPRLRRVRIGGGKLKTPLRFHLATHVSSLPYLSLFVSTPPSLSLSLHLNASASISSPSPLCLDLQRATSASHSPSLSRHKQAIVHPFIHALTHARARSLVPVLQLLQNSHARIPTPTNCFSPLSLLLVHGLIHPLTYPRTHFISLTASDTDSVGRSLARSLSRFLTFSLSHSHSPIRLFMTNRYPPPLYQLLAIQKQRRDGDASRRLVAGV